MGVTTLTEFYAQHENEIFPAHSAGVILKDIQNYIYGSGKLHKTLGMFFDRLRFGYTRKDSRYTPMQVLMDENLLELLWKRVDSKPRLFPDGRNSVKSFSTAIGIGWSQCRSVANFPVTEAREIYKKYCPSGGLIYDPSAGFGSRMAVALLDGYGYVATDPNKDLYHILMGFYKSLLDSQFVKASQEFNVYCQGSEVVVPELVGRVDFVFTSPPYFNLEKYSDDGAASTKNYNSFPLWGKEYVIPTVRNIKSYLKPGAIACINIKNIPGCALYDAWEKVFQKIGGFKELESHRIHIARRQYGKGRGNNMAEKLKNFWAYTSEEKVMVFKKEGGNE